MAKFLDNLDIIDADGNAVNVIIADRDCRTIANDNATHIGNLSSLDTTAKDNLVNSINEVKGDVVTVSSDLSTLGGTVSTLSTDLSNLGSDVSDIATDVSNLDDKVESILEDYIYLNVRDYGAKGDGVTDDTTAIQSCLADATTKSVIVFPDGEYVINGTVNISKSGIKIMGVGVNSIIKRTTQSNTPVFNISNVTKTTGFECKDMQFKNITNGECFIFGYAFDTYVHNCLIDTVKKFVVYGESGNANTNIWSRIENIVGNISVNDSIFCEVYGYTNGVHIRNCQINSEATFSSTFLSVAPYTGVDTVEVLGCLVQRCTYGVVVTDANTSEVIQNFFIRNNIFDSGEQNCIIVNKTTYNSIMCRFMISDNWFNVSDGIPVVFTGTMGEILKVSINDNIFVKSNTRAILTQGDHVHSILIDGNTFNGFNVVTTSSPLDACVTIGGGSNAVTISNNGFSPSNDVSANNTYGVYLASGVQGCVVNGNNFAGVSYAITGTPDNAKGNYPSTVDT